MANVNYIYERETFVRHARDNRYTGDEILLWNALFTIFNERAMRNGQVWPDGFVRISNKELLSWLPYGENTLIRARGSLVNPDQHQPTLVDYLKGKRNTDMPQYRMRWFTVEDGRYAREGYIQNEGNMMGNMGGNMQGNMMGNGRGKLGDIILNINQQQANIQPSFPQDEDDPTERARACARKEAKAQFTKYFGRTAGEAELDLIARVSVANRTQALLGQAFEIASVYGARSPAPYVAKLCEEWGNEYIQTPKELAEYEFLNDCIKGDMDSAAITPEEARKRIEDSKILREARSNLETA